jgi:hypothetical protein
VRQGEGCFVLVLVAVLVLEGHHCYGVDDTYSREHRLVVPFGTKTPPPGYILHST